MLYDYQREELRQQYERAKHALKSNCALIEDEVAVAVYEHIQQLECFIENIAKDWVELSHDKIRWQRDEYITVAKELRDMFCVEYNLEQE